MLRIEHLTKGYLGRLIFDDFSTQLEPGQYLLHGPNGCGKSTLLRWIARLEPAESGHLLWHGESVTTAMARQLMGISADAIEFPPFLSFDAILKYWQQSYPDAAVASYLTGFNLQDVLSQTWQHASVGQRKKLSLVLALSRPVQMLLLDEPYNGLDDVACGFLTEVLVEHPAVLTVIVSHQHQPLFAGMRSLRLSAQGLHPSMSEGA